MNPARPAAPLLALLLLLAGCACPCVGEPAAPSPDALPAATDAPEVGPEVGKAPPPFRLAAPGADRPLSLEEVLAGPPRVLVLVFGAHDCSYSIQEVEELAASGLGVRDAGILAVVSGSPGDVAASSPPDAPFPILVDPDGAVLRAYGVLSTPSVVVVAPSGRIAYIGDGGYLPVEGVRDLAARAARGDPIDPATVRTEGG